jgi:uncharacterized RDD family membrane protein YckC
MANDPQWYAPPREHAAERLEDHGEVRHAETAGFGIRLGARVADAMVGVIVGAVGGAFGRITVSAMANRHVAGAGREGRVGGLTVVSFALSMLAGVAYHALAEGIGGASLGKLLFGLRVRREDLQPCGVGAGVVRSLAYFVDALFFGLIAYSAMSKSRWNQRVGDRWARTIVVFASRVPVSARGSLGLGLALGVVADLVLCVVATVGKAL